MSEFEYILGFLSLLFAIMVGRLISGLSMVNAENGSWQHLAWLVILFWTLVVGWWFIWSLRHLVWTFDVYLLALLPALPLMYVVSVLTPDAAPVRWIEHVRAVRPRLMLGLLVYQLVTFFWNFVLLERVDVFSLLPAALFAVGAWTRREPVHVALLTLLGAMCLWQFYALIVLADAIQR